MHWAADPLRALCLFMNADDQRQGEESHHHAGRRPASMPPPPHTHTHTHTLSTCALTCPQHKPPPTPYQAFCFRPDIQHCEKYDIGPTGGYCVHNTTIETTGNHNTLDEHVCEKLAKELFAGKSVIDLGCGRGQYGGCFARYNTGIQYEGYDGSEGIEYSTGMLHRGCWGDAVVMAAKVHLLPTHLAPRQVGRQTLSMRPVLHMQHCSYPIPSPAMC